MLIHCVIFETWHAINRTRFEKACRQAPVEATILNKTTVFLVAVAAVVGGLGACTGVPTSGGSRSLHRRAYFWGGCRGLRRRAHGRAGVVAW